MGCGLVAAVEGGRIVDVQGDEGHAVSRGRLCARGTAFVQGSTVAERLTAPATRARPGGALQPVDDWKSGLDLAAERLRQVKERHGPGSLLIACDREGGLDFHLGALRFAQLWGTSQVVHRDGRPLDPWPDALEGTAAPCPEWVHAGCLLLVEADLAAAQPVAFGWVQEAQRLGAQVVAADARFTATLAKASRALRIEPGRGNLLGLALTKLVLEERGGGSPAVEEAFADAAGWGAAYERMSLDGAGATLGIAIEELRAVARLLVKSGPVTVITGRELASLPHHRVWLTLARAMGWTAQRGGGWYPLDGGAPALAVQGEVAGSPPTDAAPPAPEELEPGGVRAVICSGDALADDLSPLARLADQAEVVVHFGAFPNATWERASLTFPAALWAERDGPVFADDRSVQWGRRIVEPPAGCRSGLELWVELARRFGWEKQFPWATEDGRADHAAFYGWALARTAATAGLRLDDLRDRRPGALAAWPALDGARSGALRASLVPHPAPPALAAGATADPAYPLTVVSARTGCRSGDASRFWPWTAGLVAEDAVQIHPETALLLGIENGDAVLVDTPRGGWHGRAQLSRVVPRWTVAAAVGATGVPARVHRTDPSPDEARNLLERPTP